MNKTDEQILNGVLAQFQQLCRYPHPSWGEAPLADYVEKLLRGWGLLPVRDEWNNIMVDVPASPGRENGPMTIVQGHLDMVCAVKPGSKYVPAKSPVVSRVENGWLCSDGNSSLGADNNLGNAVVLWLMDQNVPHGPVRLLFTVAEEVGLQGAKRVDPTWLAGAQYLINTDGFMLGKAIVSSAGGYREKFTRILETTARTKPVALALELSGFPGGHSGYDIHRGRTNPIRLMAQILAGQKKYELLNLSGGHADNAIPMNCTALVAVDEDAVAEWSRAIQSVSREISDGILRVHCVECDLEAVWAQRCRDEVLNVLNGIHIGVYAWRDKEKEQVSASSNLGMVSVVEDQVKFACFIRAARQEDEQALAEQHMETAGKAGFSGSVDSYPGWPEREENPLADTMAAVWKELTGTDMSIETVHVGLEPSVLGAKNSHMLMVNTGPDILDPHSLEERAPLDGIPVYARLLAETLNRIGNEQKSLAN